MWQVAMTMMDHSNAHIQAKGQKMAERLAVEEGL
jgi:hypothetical protein